MKIKIERETKWNPAFKQVHTKYFVWVGESCTAVTENKDEAIDIAHQIVESPVELGSEIVYEIER
jgi:hypothetical protein